MTQTAFYIPAVNLMGAGCLKDAIARVKSYGFSRALIVTDGALAKLGAASQLRNAGRRRRAL